MEDVYLGTGEHVLVSVIEDRITGATASYIVDSAVSVTASSDGYANALDAAVGSAGSTCSASLAL